MNTGAIMTDLKIEYIAVNDLKPWANNARTHSKKQVKQIAASITKFKFTNPILIDDESNILAGHGRVKAAKLLNIEIVPCVRLSNMSAVQKRAYVLADNKLAENAGWDENILSIELQGIKEMDIDFDIGLTGFSIGEIDLAIEQVLPEEPNDPADEVLPSDENLRPVYPGDVFTLGQHRLICGDALNSHNLDLLMDGQKAVMVFTDPPYNVRIDGNVCGLGSIKHSEFQMASGEMSKDEFTSFLKTSFENLAGSSIDGSIHFICMDWRHISEIMSAGNAVYSELKNMLVWVKDNGGMGTFYRSRHELIFAFKHGTAPHINSFELGQHGRYRTNIWEYKGMNSRGNNRDAMLALHPTVKPVQMIADAIRDVSGRGDIVLDIFAGSGSTLIAAHKTGRRAYLAEIDPIYCARLIKRWEVYSNDMAELVSRHPDAEDNYQTNLEAAE